MAKELSFTVEEYRGRIARLQALLQEQGCAGMLVNTPENLTYLTGYRTTGYYTYQGVIVPADGEPMMITRFFEEENVLRYSWTDNRLPVTDNDDPVALTVKALEEMGLRGKRVGVELDCWFLTNRQFTELREAAPDTQFVDLGGTVEQLRLIKSPAEIEYIRHACRIAEAGMKAGIENAREGLSEDVIAGRVVDAIVSNGGEYWGAPPYVCSGPRTAIPHATWGGRVMERNDLLYLELPGCVHRYGGCLMRTVALGTPTDEQKRLAEASMNALDAAIAAIKPGVPSSEVDNACRGTVAKAGFGAGFKHRTGYSIGLNFPPDWGEGHIFSLKASETRPLAPGMTFHLVPLVFAGDRFGIGYSETVLVTEDGCEVLTNFERKFEIDGIG